MGGDADDESRQTISAAQLLSMGSCSAEEIGHIRLIVAWGNRHRLLPPLWADKKSPPPVKGLYKAYA